MTEASSPTKYQLQYGEFDDQKEEERQKSIRCDGSVRKKLGLEIGKAVADKSKGLFSADDWQCNKCGNVNWARRNQCNMCKAPKFGLVEERTGYGGGYNDRGVVEYVKHDDSDNEYDEFGRKRKQKSLINNDDIQEEEEDEDDYDLTKYDLSSWNDNNSYNVGEKDKIADRGNDSAGLEKINKSSTDEYAKGQSKGNFNLRYDTKHYLKAATTNSNEKDKDLTELLFSGKERNPIFLYSDIKQSDKYKSGELCEEQKSRDLTERTRYSRIVNEKSRDRSRSPKEVIN